MAVTSAVLPLRGSTPGVSGPEIFTRACHRRALEAQQKSGHASDQSPSSLSDESCGSGECHLAQVGRYFRRDQARLPHSRQAIWLHALNKLESGTQGQQGVRRTRGKVTHSPRRLQWLPFRVRARPSADSFLHAVFTVPSGMEFLSILSLGAP